MISDKLLRGKRRVILIRAFDEGGDAQVRRMTTDASDLLLPHVRQFTIGFVLTEPPAPKVLGSGVLLSVGNVSGILTCAALLTSITGSQKSAYYTVSVETELFKGKS